MLIRGVGAPTRRVGDVTVRSFRRDGDTCERNLALADRRQIWVVTKRLGSPAPDPCELGDAATDYAVGVDRGRLRAPADREALRHRDDTGRRRREETAEVMSGRPAAMDHRAGRPATARPAHRPTPRRPAPRRAGRAAP